VARQGGTGQGLEVHGGARQIMAVRGKAGPTPERPGKVGIGTAVQVEDGNAGTGRDWSGLGGTWLGAARSEAA